MALPKYKTDIRELTLLQQTWASQLDPVVTNTFTGGLVLKNVELSTGSNIINHKLGRKLQGWTMVRVRASATFYDTQDVNPNPELTLFLTSSANVTVDIYVF